MPSSRPSNRTDGSSATREIIQPRSVWARTLWGTLVGLILLIEIVGAAIGAASGAIAGAVTDVGLNDRLKDVAASLDTLTPHALPPVAELPVAEVV
jgi:uncharacterized membrane protein